MTIKTKQTVRLFQRSYYVYILSSLGGTLYVGITDDLVNRIRQHQEGTFDGFTKKYKIDRLMYFETYSDSKFAEHREEQIKKSRREKKIALFIKGNPHWKDLTAEISQATAFLLTPKTGLSETSSMDIHRGPSPSGRDFRKRP